MEPQNIARLVNCLDTILELESQLRSLHDAGALMMEIASLRSLIFGLKQDRTPVDEEDVERIELATTFFLQELKAGFQYLDSVPFPGRVLQ